MHGGLAGVVVFGQLLPAAQGDHGLAHDVLVSAERRAGGPAGRSAASGLKLLASEGVEGELLQRDRPLSGARRAWNAPRPTKRAAAREHSGVELGSLLP